LLFATLLHDIGKDTGGRQHAERGAELSDTILRRMAFAQEDIHGVQHLVAKHLKMYLVATRRDIDDTRTLEAFASEVEGTTGLRELYLLTIADVSTTSPTALTTWKQRMLDELFSATDRWLTTGETRRGSAAQQAIIEEVLGLLSPSTDRVFADSFLNSASPRYLATNKPEWIVKHLEMAEQAQTIPANVTIMQIGDPHVEMAVVTDDEPGVLAKICATLSARKFKVVSAQIHSWLDPNGRRRVLDLFWVRAGNDPEGAAQALPKINQQLTDLVCGRLGVGELVSGKPHEVRWSLRPSPPVPIQVRIDNHGASRHTILEVITKDRADLLFWISRMIFEAGLSIDLAKIHTEGVRVTDVFYVCTKDANKLEDEVRLTALKESITRTLQNLEIGNEA
jgi:[protein-PII] uridylyltransferase